MMLRRAVKKVQSSCEIANTRTGKLSSFIVEELENIDFSVCVCVFVGFCAESTLVPISQETNLLYSGCQAFRARLSILHPHPAPCLAPPLHPSSFPSQRRLTAIILAVSLSFSVFSCLPQLSELILSDWEAIVCYHQTHCIQPSKQNTHTHAHTHTEGCL